MRRYGGWSVHESLIRGRVGCVLVVSSSVWDGMCLAIIRCINQHRSPISRMSIRDPDQPAMSPLRPPLQRHSISQDPGSCLFIPKNRGARPQLRRPSTIIPQIPTPGSSSRQIESGETQIATSSSVTLDDLSISTLHLADLGCVSSSLHSANDPASVARQASRGASEPETSIESAADVKKRIFQEDESRRHRQHLPSRTDLSKPQMSPARTTGSRIGAPLNTATSLELQSMHFRATEKQVMQRQLLRQLEGMTGLGQRLGGWLSPTELPPSDDEDRQGGSPAKSPAMDSSGNHVADHKFFPTSLSRRHSTLQNREDDGYGDETDPDEPHPAFAQDHSETHEEASSTAQDDSGLVDVSDEDDDTDCMNNAEDWSGEEGGNEADFDSN